MEFRRAYWRGGWLGAGRHTIGMIRKSDSKAGLEWITTLTVVLPALPMFAPA